MTLKTALHAIDIVGENALKEGVEPGVNFFGGEPLLKWEEIIVPSTKYIREKYGEKFKVSIITNGLLIDEEKLKFMKKYNIKLLFSMDGNKVSQDRNRRPKSDGSS